MKYLIGILILIAILLASCKQIDYSQVLDNRQEECSRVGGEWITFGTTCVDSCSSERKASPVCGAAETDGCECGEDQCWNGRTCEPN